MSHFIITNKPFKRKDGTSQIIIRYTYLGKHHTNKIPNLYCKPEQLDKATHRIVKGYDKDTMRIMNTQITEIVFRGNEIIKEYEEPEPEYFFKLLFEAPKEEKKKKLECIVDLYEEWINTQAGSVVYSTTLPHLIDFKEHRGSLPVQDYSKILLYEFQNHLLNNGYIPNNRRMKKGKKSNSRRESPDRVMFKHSALKKHLKHFKFFGRYLTDLELPINQNFRDYKFNVSKSPEIPDTIALSKKEFDQLFYFDLSSNFQLNLTKSAFIIGTASGGLRISDLLDIDESKINRDNYTISFTQIKTGGDVNNPMAKAYIEPHLDLYLDNLHNMPSPQEFNRRLKEIAQLIGWDRVEFVNEYRGNGSKPKRIKIDLKDNISSKYMRKTFISIMVELGYSKEIIKTFSGHRDDKVIDHYIQIHGETKRKAIEGFKPEQTLISKPVIQPNNKKAEIQEPDQLELF